MRKECTHCSAKFEITQEDLEFYEKISPELNGKKFSIPAPTLCPNCRCQRRRAQRNERYLFHRKCDTTGKDIVAFYPKESQYTVVDKDEWWSDNWDPKSFGMDADLQKPFFQQFAELRLRVPRAGFMSMKADNSPYSPYCVSVKNCYLSVSLVESEDVHYSYQTNSSKDCVDCFRVTKGEMSYNCIDCVNIYGCCNSQNCDNSSNLFFCEDCSGCTNCIGCKNLKNASYFVLNKKVEPAEFEKIRASLSSYTEKNIWKEKVSHLFSTLPYRSSHMLNCENCSGDYLTDSRNAIECFDAINLEECSYMNIVPNGSRQCRDGQYAPDTELVYESISGVGSYSSCFIIHTWNCKNAYYSEDCHNCTHVFGCIGLRHQKFCILNKQYSEKEYGEVIEEIIKRMQADREWGEFFPVESSPFAYNESIAQEEFALTRDEVESMGFQWRDPEDRVLSIDKVIPASSLPDSIQDIPDDILNWAIECVNTGRPFRIIKQELEFYRKLQLPIPRLHPDERHKEHIAARNPRKLWNRTCAKCSKDIQTTYAPERPEKVYCERCYLETVY